MQDRPVVVDVADAYGRGVTGPSSVVVLKEFGLNRCDIGVLCAVRGAADRPTSAGSDVQRARYGLRRPPLHDE